MAVTRIQVKLVAGKTYVDPEKAILYKSHGDTAEWEGVPAGLEFEIVFGERSPFEEKILPSRKFKGGKPLSGRIAIDPMMPEEHFEYTVNLDNASPLDPGIIIRP